MNSWDGDFWMDKFERGDITIAPDEIIFRVAEPYDYSSNTVFKIDSNKEVTATSNVSYATLDGLDNSCATPAHYNFGVKGLRRPITLNFCF